MKTKVILFGIVLIVVCACSTQKFAIEEMTITDPEQIKQFKSEQISVSTKDSVNVEIRNQETQKVFTRKRVLRDQLVNNYNFISDSLFINDPSFKTIFGLKTISSIKFNGLFDNKAGFIANEEIHKNLPYTTFSYTITSGFSGAIIGGLVSVLLPFGGSSKSLIDGVGYGAVSGLLIGFIIGQISNSNNQELEQIIEGIRENRRISNGKLIM